MNCTRTVADQRFDVDSWQQRATTNMTNYLSDANLFSGIEDDWSFVMSEPNARLGSGISARVARQELYQVLTPLQTIRPSHQLKYTTTSDEL